MIKHIISALLFILPIVGSNECIAARSCESIYRYEIYKDRRKADAIVMIRQFYEEYVAALLQNDNANKTSIVKHKYIDPQLLRRMSKMYECGGLDYDPFLQAQDYDESSISNMRIEKASADMDTYRVYLWDSYDKKYKHVDMILRKIGDNYKIVDITLPNHDL